VEKYSHFFETEDQLTQFVAAFDDMFLYRYDKNRVPKEKIAVRYVFGPKQRVLYDIVNQAKNLTLPVIAIEQTNIRRDSSRVQNKDQHMYRPHLNDRSVSKIPQPVPVNYDINLSFIANYKSDVDQIVSNFIPWCNPYFIISWKIPEGFLLDFTDELRSEVSWSGDISYEYPIDITAQDKYRIVGNTSFTIKGWIFPAVETPVAPIYVITSTFTALSSGTNLETYELPTIIDYTTTDVVTISAYPEFTNYFINGKPYQELSLNDVSGQTFTFYGKRFDYGNTWYLSANQSISGMNYEEIDTLKFPTISAYRIPDSFITTVSDNIAVVSLSSNYVSLSSGNYTFVTANSAGWATSTPIFIDTDNVLYNGYTIYYNGEEITYN